MQHKNGVFRYRNIISRSREPVIALPVCLVEIGQFVLVPKSQQEAQGAPQGTDN